ncbi:MAG: hypothetical protein ACF8XB_20840 [Planctomycetota bacterium JB042]
MSDEPVSADEALLQRILLGEVDPRSDAARELFERAPESRRRLRELVEVRATLDHLGAAEERAGASPDAPSAAIEQLRGEILSPTPERRGPPEGSRRAWWIAIAAGLVLASLPLLVDRDDGPGDGLLGPEPSDLRPRGEVEAFEEFRWRTPLPAGGRYRVRVEPLGVTSPLLSRPVWRPGPDVLARLRDEREIVWGVWVVDANGDETPVGEQRAWRSSR